MRVYIEDLTFETIIGILNFERKKAQKVILNATFEYEYNNNFIDYAKVAEFLENEMKRKKFHLLEDAIDVLCTTLLKKYPQILWIELKITKPSILANSKVSVSHKYSRHS